VAGVRPADPNQDVVLGREVEADVALALAAVLSADNDVHELLPDRREQPETRRASQQRPRVRCRARVDDEVGVRRERGHAGLRGVLLDLRVVGQLLDPAGQALPVGVSTGALVQVRG